MIDVKQPKFKFAFVALLMVFAACKGESPTTPSSTTPIGTPSGGTPPTGATVTLTVSNASPLANSTSIITATVTENGTQVPNGTAVQFTTTVGSFTDIGSSGQTVIKTTTNGVATATLTASGGTAVVTATVNNVSKSTTITFSTTPPIPPVPNTAPTISSITPATGRMQGGETITINGTNFRAPLRVIFKCEGSATTPPDPAACNGQTTKDALIVSVSPTQIVAITPPFDVVAGTAISTSITVLTQAGTPNEQTVTQGAGFTYASLSLTPIVRYTSPTSGPIGGGTRISIFGDNFQSPVQVFFNAAEAQVLSVNLHEIVVMSPRASDTDPSGSGTVTGPVPIRVRNGGSGTETTFNTGFRYTAKMQITAAGPTSGPITGGTRVTIDGIGFDDPVAVTIGGVAAQVIRVSGTQIIAITQPPAQISCSGVEGEISVTNVENGDSATAGVNFSFLVPQPAIVSVVSPVVLGGTTSVVVLNAQGIPRILFGNTPGTITATTSNPNGTTTFTVQVPNTLTLTPLSCGVGSTTAPQPTQFDVVYQSLTTGCTATFANGVTVTPAATPTLTLSGALVPFVGRITPGQPGPPVTLATVAVTPTTQTVSIVNTGTGPLIVNSITQTNAGGTGCLRFSPPPFTPATLTQCQNLDITVSYSAPTVPTPVPDVCQYTINTTAGSRTVQVVGSAN